jgi:hypothetical protein
VAAGGASTEDAETLPAGACAPGAPPEDGPEELEPPPAGAGVGASTTGVGTGAGAVPGSAAGSAEGAGTDGGDVAPVAAPP